MSQANSPNPAFAQGAAKASWMSCGAVFALLAFGGRIGSVLIIERISLGLMLFALGSATVALAGIRKHGTKHILWPALTGLTITGLLLFIFVTNFTVARARAITEPSNTTSGATTRQPRVATFDGRGLTFAYDTRYKATPFGDKAQVLLQHEESYVVLTRYDEPMNVRDYARQAVEKIRLGFEQKNYTDITQGSIETIPGYSGSAAKAQLRYTSPALGRVVADLFVTAGETNAVSIAHYYPENRSGTAKLMVAPVLRSFLKSGEEPP